MIDYKEELKRLEQNENKSFGDYWKPEQGQYRVKPLGEIEQANPYEEEGKPPQLRKQLALLVDGEKIVTWTMPFGQTSVSTYGQLIKIAANRGQLEGSEFVVVVTGTGKNKRFTIVS